MLFRQFHHFVPEAEAVHFDPAMMIGFWQPLIISAASSSLARPVVADRLFLQVRTGYRHFVRTRSRGSSR